MFKTLLVASALSLAVGAAASASIVVNGSFEADDVLAVGSWGIFPSITGWTNISDVTDSPSGGVELQTAGVLGGADVGPYDGKYYVEMDGNANYTISQDVTLAAGRYALTFAYRPRMDYDTNGIAYSVAGLSGIVAGPDLSAPLGVWTPITQYFTVGSGGIYALTFSGAGPSDSLGGLLDGVAINAVPVPASGLLLLGGFGGLVALRRRKSV